MRALRWTAIAGIATAVLAVGAAPAAAHTSLVSSTPAANTTLVTAPTEVTLTFDDPIATQGTQLVARTSGGDAVALGPTRVDGDAVSATWPAGAASGSYVVSYRVVSADGHPVEGSLSFQIAGSATSPTGSPSGSATGSSTVPPSPSSSAGTPTPAPAPASSDAPVGLIGALVVAAALAVGAGVVIARRRG